MPFDTENISDTHPMILVFHDMHKLWDYHIICKWSQLEQSLSFEVW